jgi:hypothetical protein
MRMQFDASFDPDIEKKGGEVNLLKLTLIIIFFVLLFYGSIFLLFKNSGINKRKLKLSFKTGYT